METYLIGGSVRDELLGIKSKDYDYTVVIDEGDVPFGMTAYELMLKNLKDDGYKVFKEDEKYLTVRAQVPANDPRGNLTADFVLSRKDGNYGDGRRPDNVQVGTLLDDISRRDFTCNAIAKDEHGNLIDPFNGQEDISRGVLRCVGDPQVRFAEDALRAVRALRFSVTKNFWIAPEVKWSMQTKSVLDSIVDNIADERISDELSKMFRFNTVHSLLLLNEFPQLTTAMFAGKVSLDSTLKQKGRG